MNRIVPIGALAIALSPAFAHKIRVDFNHDTHFSCYKTYRWVPAAGAHASPTQFPNQLMDERIVSSIDEALGARGLKRVAAGGDLLVSYQVQVTELPQYTTFADGWGWGGGWGGGWGPGWGPAWGTGFATTTVQIIYQGTLVIDMVDAHHKQLVFQGTSTQAVSSHPEKNTRKLAKAVNEVLERYPPRP
jgi:hypothetical protein